MRYGEGIYLFGDSDFLVIRFIENPGMAFGFEFGGIAGKLALSVFRLLASRAIVCALWKLVKTKAPKGLITCVALILAGAVGNILDSMFYGLMFDKGEGVVSYSGLAKLTEFGSGYAPFLQGNVVDMISFSIFPPIFNIADAAISVGVIWIILFQRKYFPKEEKQIEVEEESLDSDVTEEFTAEVE